jgi:very-short-patch-repair endonuclease
MTEPKRKLWSFVRGKQLGVKIPRQGSIERYIVDFSLEERKLVIQLDGSQHCEPEERRSDRIRDGYLHKQGYTILRIDDLDMLKYPDSILVEIVSYSARDSVTNAPKKDLE